MKIKPFLLICTLSRSRSETAAVAKISLVQYAAKVTVYDWKKCEKTYHSAVTPRQFCTYETETGPCDFDWGDPLVYKGKVYGLLTGLSECLSYPAVYTDVPAYVDCIKHTIQE
ncbi:hypothetical protein J6590_048808 [Homalodisca vitripennis]|nr:hypothetical protein J6590_048808 [Homalodisca vitripennis]